MKKTVYIETTVVSYLTARPSRDVVIAGHQEATRDLWNKLGKDFEVNGIQILVTWNFSHINNPFTRMMIRKAVENAGYECPEICSPDELLEAGL